MSKAHHNLHAIHDFLDPDGIPYYNY